ncbi:MAG: GNAT family N-acetyltransferase [Clostridiales bacterium]|nr:GNAT family N-acetyltransferase [Clostridiales bacterium]
MNLKYIDVNYKTISDELFEQIYTVEQSSTYEPYEKDILNQIVMFENNTTFLCLDGEKVVAHATFNSETKKYDNSIYMSNIVTLPNYQGLGIAKQIILNACNFFENNQKDIISLQVDNENIIAYNFYKKLGFVNVEELSDKEESFMIIQKQILKQNIVKSLK